MTQQAFGGLPPCLESTSSLMLHQRPHRQQPACRSVAARGQSTAAATESLALPVCGESSPIRCRSVPAAHDLAICLLVELVGCLGSSPRDHRARSAMGRTLAACTPPNPTATPTHFVRAPPQLLPAPRLVSRGPPQAVAPTAPQVRAPSTLQRGVGTSVRASYRIAD